MTGAMTLHALTSCIIEASREVLGDRCTIVQVRIFLEAIWLAGKQLVPGRKHATHLGLVKPIAVPQYGAVVIFCRHLRG